MFHTDDDNEIEQQVTPGAVAEYSLRYRCVVMRQFIEQAVKPAEKPFSFATYRLWRRV